MACSVSSFSQDDVKRLRISRPTRRDREARDGGLEARAARAARGTGRRALVISSGPRGSEAGEGWTPRMSHWRRRNSRCRSSQELTLRVTAEKELEAARAVRGYRRRARGGKADSLTKKLRVTTPSSPGARGRRKVWQKQRDKGQAISHCSQALRYCSILLPKTCLQTWNLPLIGRVEGGNAGQTSRPIPSPRPTRCPSASTSGWHLRPHQRERDRTLFKRRNQS